MAHALSKFKRQDNEFIQVGTELGFKMRNIKRISNNLASAAISTENCDKERTKAFSLREMIDKHPEFLKEYCHFDPNSQIFRINQRRKALYSKFPSVKKCWECGITPRDIFLRRQTNFKSGQTKQILLTSQLVKLQTCVDCRKAKFCSKECQVSNWANHKVFCNRLLKLNNEIKSIKLASEAIQDMNFIFGKRLDNGVLRPIGFQNNFEDQGFDKETIEIITRTGLDLGKRIAWIINNKIGPQITLKPVQDVFNQPIPTACNNKWNEVD
jgi:hypothetical protein